MCRVADVTTLSLLVDFDTGWGGVFNIARTIRSMIKLVSLRFILKIRSARSVAAMARERLVPTGEMVDHIKAGCVRNIAIDRTSMGPI